MQNEEQEEKKKRLQQSNPLARSGGAPFTSSPLGRGVQSLAGGNSAVANVVAQGAGQPQSYSNRFGGVGSMLAKTPIPTGPQTSPGEASFAPGPFQFPAKPNLPAPAPMPAAGGLAAGAARGVASPATGPGMLSRGNVAPPAVAPAVPAAPTIGGTFSDNNRIVNPGYSGPVAQPAFQMQGRVPMGFTANEIGQAKQELNQLPAVQAASGTMANAQIAQNMGSRFTNAQTAKMADDAQLVAQNPNIPIEQAVRNRDTATANAALARSPRALQAQGDQEWLKRTRAAAMPQAEAQQNIENTKGLGTDRRASAVARGEKFKRDNDAADQLRRSQPLAQMNIARAQERPAQLLEKRERREAMGAANRMNAQALGQRDPKVKALMAAQAGEMAKAVGQRQPARRTTMGDIEDKQTAERLASQKIDADARGIQSSPRAAYDAARVEKTKAEIDAIRGKMSEQQRARYDTVQKAYLKEVELRPDSDEAKAYKAELDAILGGGATAGGNSQASPATVADQASFDKLPSGSWFVNPKDGRVLQKK